MLVEIAWLRFCPGIANDFFRRIFIFYVLAYFEIQPWLGGQALKIAALLQWSLIR